MQRGHLDDLLAFVAVGRERSFTKAAAKLGVSQSALSHTIRGLEARLGVRLPTRTTRSVAPTAAGGSPPQNLGPPGVFREKPAGSIRITAGDHPVNAVLWPRLAKFLPKYPDIKVEIVIENGLADIVAQRYDAGVGLGEQVSQDMIGVRIGPDVRFALVGAKSYFAERLPPKTPQELVDHTCINLRLPTYGGLYAWEFERDGRELKVRVEGQLTFNSIFQVLDAALAGFGLAYMPEDLALPHIAKGRLRRVLGEWCPAWPGYPLYYPSRRQPSAAFALLVDALRYRGKHQGP